jgi:hypothetical protein
VPRQGRDAREKPPRIALVLARVLTFFAESGDLATLADSLRSELPPIYGTFPGFLGLLVLEKPGARSHVIAMTIWQDEESLWASEKIADAFADRITHASGNAVARNTYNVLGSVGIEKRKRDSAEGSDDS